MKTRFFSAILISVLIGFAQPAKAGWHGGWHHGWWGGPRFSFVVGAPFYYPPYPYYPYYYDPPYYYPARPVYYGREVAGDSVAFDVQQRLAGQGYYHGPIDGIVGSGTRPAIAAYQRDHGLDVTRTIDGLLLRSMRL
jgi:hypothetical protein